MDKGFVGKEKPGYETTESLWSPNKKYLQKFCNLHIIPFMRQGGIKKGDLCVDIGEHNPRIEYIENVMGIKVKTIDKEDFNWNELDVSNLDTILALEMFEHVQNPLYFMKQLKMALADNGSIYVLIPCNPTWLWHERHFFEMDRKHFEKWICTPLDMKIVRYKKIWHVASWRAYLIGFRPLWRILSGKMSLKAFIRLLLYVQWWICEIKEDDS